MKLKKLSRTRQGILNKWICCVEGCKKPIAHNGDGTTEGNFKCEHHTRAYYAQWLFKNSAL